MLKEYEQFDWRFDAQNIVYDLIESKTDLLNPSSKDAKWWMSFEDRLLSNGANYDGIELEPYEVVALGTLADYVDDIKKPFRNDTFIIISKSSI